MSSSPFHLYVSWLVGWLCFTPHRQRGHLETAPPFTVLAKDVKLGFYTVPTGNRTPTLTAMSMTMRFVIMISN